MIDFDVVIVGAGLTGIGAACHLQRLCPSKRYAILESRDAIGGTWDLYRYPGIRSDSDMHTLGYDFKPWLADKAIADGPSILSYVNQAADEHDVRRHIQFGRRLDHAAWSTPDACWTLTIKCTDNTKANETLRCGMLLMCTGYYSYDAPHRPRFEGEETFSGPMFHPQLWPAGLDYTNKRVVVIGSGATAMTVVPAMAARGAAHVTMLQRSPTYVITRPAKDALANGLRKLLPDNTAYALTRLKNVAIQRYFYRNARKFPEWSKKYLIDQVRKRLPAGYDVEKHFAPRYAPWDERVCLIPDDDLFEAITAGTVLVVTDGIKRITPRGIELESGQTLDAEVIVVATGITLKVSGGATFDVDGARVHPEQTLTYKGLMYSDVPNLVWTFGYVNASWTLRADLNAQYACHLINRMQELGMRQCTPRLRPEDRTMPTRPWIDSFTPGYLRRALHLFPKQGERTPWVNTQDYAADKKLLAASAVNDGVMIFSNPKA